MSARKYFDKKFLVLLVDDSSDDRAFMQKLALEESSNICIWSPKRRMAW